MLLMNILFEIYHKINNKIFNIHLFLMYKQIKIIRLAQSMNDSVISTKIITFLIREETKSDKR